MDIATAAQFEFLASNRSGLKDLQSFDKHTYCTAARTIPNSQQQLVRCAQSFGMWSAGNKLEVFQEGNGRCPFCGDADSGVIHEVWSCRAFAEEQLLQDEGLGRLSPANTPAHVLLGFPPKIDARLDEFLIPFLGEPSGWPSHCKANALLFHHGRLREDACELRDEAILQQGCTLGEHIVLHHTQQCGQPDKLLIEAVSDAAPSEPNTFTDGSVVGPTSSTPVGSFGVWIPGRKAQRPSEQELAFTGIIDWPASPHDGIGLAGVLGGSCISSTRAELAGAIAGLCLKGPRHFQSDS